MNNQDNIENAANTQLDPLTGAYTRVKLDSFLNFEDPSLNWQNTKYSLCFIDLDHFKSINDAYGHQRGDEVLKEFVKRTQSTIRDSDLLFRYGGDEFVLACGGIDKKEAAVLVERILNRFREEVFPGTPPIKLSLSVGIADSLKDGIIPKNILESADKRVYQAKKAGRNRSVYQDDIHSAAARNQEFSRILEREHQRNQFLEFLDNIDKDRSSSFEIRGPGGSGRSWFLKMCVEMATIRDYAIISLSGNSQEKYTPFCLLSKSRWPCSFPFASGACAVKEQLEQWLNSHQYSGIILALDDIEYVDTSSLSFIKKLLLDSKAAGINIIYTSAADSVSSFRIPDRHYEILINPLSIDSLTVWIRNVFHEEADTSFIQWLYDQTNGIPGLITRSIYFLIEKNEISKEFIFDPDFYRAVKIKQELKEPALGIPENIPYMYTPFTGRNTEIFEVERLLQDKRFVTLLGPGGIGKTRISVEVGRQMFRFFKNGVYFVSLENINDHVLIADTLSGVFKLPEMNSPDVLSSLCTYLANKELLLILDNFEHIIKGASIILTLLNAAGGLKILISSREILHLSGETVFRVPPLQIPCLDPLPSLEELMQVETVSLFLTRAQSQLPDFILTDENALFIAVICNKLDGLPLAIELAAAQIRLFPPETILKLLEDRFSILSGGPKDLPNRQQALRNTIDWSYNLLDSDEQKLLTQLSVFTGGFTLEAVQNVFDNPGKINIIETLISLYDKSLLNKMNSFDNSLRFNILDVIKQYAWEKHSGEGINKNLQQRHLEYYVYFAEKKEAVLEVENQVKWLNQLEDEFGNLRAALNYALQIGNGEYSLRIVAASWIFLQLHNHHYEGRVWMNRTLAIAPSSEKKVKAYEGAGWLAVVQGDMKNAEENFQAGIDLGREIDEKFYTGLNMQGLGVVSRLAGNYKQAKQAFTESFNYFKDARNKLNLAWAKCHLGVLSLEQRQYESGIELLNAAKRIFIEKGQKYAFADVYNFLGHAYYQLEKYDESLGYYYKSAAEYEDLGDIASRTRVESYIAVGLYWEPCGIKS